MSQYDPRFYSPEGSAPFCTDPLPPRPLPNLPFHKDGDAPATGPARYALWFAPPGKDFAEGHWTLVLAPSGAYRGAAVFSSVAAAVTYLYDGYARQWPEFIEIVRLTDRVRRQLPHPILMDAARSPQADGEAS